MDILKPVRNSRMELNKVYFWTSTIKDWKHLLKQDKYKQIIINALTELTNRELITVYAFVVMPNHIHIIWEMHDTNGKEMPHASFNKSTAHLITKDLKENHLAVLAHFSVKEKERLYRIWQRDPLAILIDSKAKMEQKMDYIHNNPLNQRWNLAASPQLYIWSSAGFYENNDQNFPFLKHYMDRFA